MLLQFLTPVMYPLSRITESNKLSPAMMRLYMMNPMAEILECYRQILFYRKVPDVSILTGAILFGITFLVIGEFVFSKLQKGFAEEL